VASRTPGTSSKATFYYGALNGAQNVGDGTGGQLLEVSATNEGGAVAYVTVADANRTHRKVAVPATGNWEWRPIDGVQFDGQLTVTTTAALDVSVRIA
jgi:hypothetical protein